MKNQIMTHYLTKIKTIVEKIVVSGALIDVEHVTLYTLNGLSSSYNSF